ncbi:MAG: NADH-quinone oxidoreductase subunit C [Gemmatimonadota bacterium]
MSKETPTGIDAVEEGPGESDAVPTGADAGGAVAPEHPSVTALRSRFAEAILRQEIPARGQFVVFVDPRRVREILAWLKEDPGQAYEFLSDVTAVDYGGGRPLQVVYQLWSLVHRRSLRVKAELPLTDLRIDSVQPLWATADWLEREVYDLFGVTFEGHPDLRRILMPENYAEGHPLRKDFPLRGRFSRAEQTRRALSHEVADFYIPEEMEVGREPQLVPGSDTRDSEPDESA